MRKSDRETTPGLVCEENALCLAENEGLERWLSAEAGSHRQQGHGSRCLAGLMRVVYWAEAVEGSAMAAKGTVPRSMPCRDPPVEPSCLAHDVPLARALACSNSALRDDDNSAFTPSMLARCWRG